MENIYIFNLFNIQKEIKGSFVSMNQKVLKYLAVIITLLLCMMSVASASNFFPFYQSRQNSLKKYNISNLYKYPINIRQYTISPTPTSTIPELKIRITKTENNYLYGQISGIDVSSYEVAVVIYVPGYGWVNKPYWARPITTINTDGSFKCLYITGGHDWDATKFIAFLIPKGTQVPILRGSQSHPSEDFKGYPYDVYP